MTLHPRLQSLLKRNGRIALKLKIYYNSQTTLRMKRVFQQKYHAFKGLKKTLVGLLLF